MMETVKIVPRSAGAGRLAPGSSQTQAQFALLTELMLNSATRSGGIAVRVSRSLHSRDKARSVRPASIVGEDVYGALVEAEVVHGSDYCSPRWMRYTPSGSGRRDRAKSVEGR